MMKALIEADDFPADTSTSIWRWTIAYTALASETIQ